MSTVTEGLTSVQTQELGEKALPKCPTVPKSSTSVQSKELGEKPQPKCPTVPERSTGVQSQELGEKTLPRCPRYQRGRPASSHSSWAKRPNPSAHVTREVD